MMHINLRVLDDAYKLKSVRIVYLELDEAINTS